MIDFIPWPVASRRVAAGVRQLILLALVALGGWGWATALSAAPGTPTQSSGQPWLMPLVSAAGANDGADLATWERLFAAHRGRSPSDVGTDIRRYLEAHPDSTWAASLWLNLGHDYLEAGRYSAALEVWQRAWERTRGAGDDASRRVAGAVAVALTRWLGFLGREQELADLLAGLAGRSLEPDAAEAVAEVRRELSLGWSEPRSSRRCGPVALAAVLRTEAVGCLIPGPISELPLVGDETSLAGLVRLAREAGGEYQAAFRENPAAPLLVPAVVHGNASHFTALLERSGPAGLLVDDPLRSHQRVMTEEAVLAEASGYFLVRGGPLPAGWRAVGEEEARGVRGTGICENWPEGATSDEDPQKGDDGDCHGMAVANAHLLAVSLKLRDTPVGYRPPFGPAVNVVFTYNQREDGQPALFAYANAGPKWNCNWVAYLEESTWFPEDPVRFHLDGGGLQEFVFDRVTGAYLPQAQSSARLARLSGEAWAITYPDGRRKLFDRVLTRGAGRRWWLMTRVEDASGNAVAIEYDAQARVVALRDPLGQVTKFDYERPEDPLKITRLTDPFGRSARLEYDDLGRLARITDVAGMTSEFGYRGAGDFIERLTTPYGTSRFASGEGSGPSRWLELTDPSGATERVELAMDLSASVRPYSEPVAALPKGMLIHNGAFNQRTTYYWDKKAFAEAAGDYRRARAYQWLHSKAYLVLSRSLESVKPPLQNRIWFNYPGGSAYQPIKDVGDLGELVEGDSDQPGLVGRVLDDGSTQLWRSERNAFGLVTHSVDPAGREIWFDYGGGIDLIETRRRISGVPVVVGRATYNGQHRPLTIEDAAGFVTRFAYNERGQLIGAVNARHETNTYEYDARGYLIRADGPLPGPEDSTRYTYDDVGRVRTVEGPDGYRLTLSYDELDRLTKVAHPDGTAEEFTYQRLDLAKARDREGHEMVYEYNSQRQRTKVTDPLGRVLRYRYCDCSALTELVDPLGRTTRFDYDIQGRLTERAYADGSRVTYAYEPQSGRLRSVTDEQGKVRRYDYDVTDQLIRIRHLNALVPTPEVRYEFDPDLDRVVRMVDGAGETRYRYHPPGSAGALRIAEIDGPLDHDTIRYEYDERGRIRSRTLDGSAQSYEYDPAGRLTRVVNALGAFGFSYEGPTRRVREARFPNGQSTRYDYLPLAEGFRLREVLNLDPAGSVLSRFGLAYDRQGAVTRWTQQQGATPEMAWAVTQDAVGQLRSIGETQAGSPGTQYSYAYDAAGNRTLATEGERIRSFAYNALNQPVSVEGESSTSMRYEWDGEHRLRAIQRGDRRTELSYDGLGRRVRMVEAEAGRVVSDCRYVWDGFELLEERAADGRRKRFFADGVERAGERYFYTRDHLGSVRELTDAVGGVRAAYAYGPWGEVTKLGGDLEADFGFTGHWRHAGSGLHLAPFRAYASELGRWLSRDPLGEAQGIGLYNYVESAPLSSMDPLGLAPNDKHMSFCDALKRVKDIEDAGWRTWFERFKSGWFPGGEGEWPQYADAGPWGEVDMTWFVSNYFGDQRARELIQNIYLWFQYNVESRLKGDSEFKRDRNNMANNKGWLLALLAQQYGLDAMIQAFGCKCRPAPPPIAPFHRRRRRDERARASKPGHGFQTSFRLLAIPDRKHFVAPAVAPHRKLARGDAQWAGLLCQ